MADKKRDEGRLPPKGDDIVRENERTRRHMPDDSDEFVTDAELEAREANSSPPKDKDC